MQLFAPHRDAGEIVFDFGGGHAVLNRLDNVLAMLGKGRRFEQVFMLCDLPDIYADRIGNLFEICLLVCDHGMRAAESGFLISLVGYRLL
ncbi:MAG: hypothetical protein WBW73_26465 [Rhodoplanes sp.]